MLARKALTQEDGSLYAATADALPNPVLKLEIAAH
jgi:hypothetical protein